MKLNSETARFTNEIDETWQCGQISIIANWLNKIKTIVVTKYAWVMINDNSHFTSKQNVGGFQYTIQQSFANDFKCELWYSIFRIEVEESIIIFRGLWSASLEFTGWSVGLLIVVNILCHLPNLHYVVFRDRTNDPWLVWIPGEVANLRCVTAVNKL